MTQCTVGQYCNKIYIDIKNFHSGALNLLFFLNNVCFHVKNVYMLTTRGVTSFTLIVHGK